VASREPFSRQKPRADLEPGDGSGLVAAFEWAAQAYGWGPTTIREELSDEQLVAYFDAAAERLRAEREAEFDSRVEAARLGTIFAHDAKTYQRWHRRNAATEGRRRPADDQVIEHQIMQLASMFPGAVSFGTMPGGAG
jgi:hypothetical protein